MATGLRPMDSAAISESFTARIAEPQAERDRRQNANTSTPVSTMASSATPRSPNGRPASCGCGTPMMPFWPPVRSRHSTRLFSTTKAKAMVIMAR